MQITICSGRPVCTGSWINRRSSEMPSTLLNQGAFRPSHLPQLAECVWHRTREDFGEEVKRGERVDLLYRTLLSKHDGSCAELLATADVGELAAANWAVNTTQRLVRDGGVVADKAHC